MTHRLTALFFDLGDTIMREDSQVKENDGTTLCAELIPGIAEALRRFRKGGYRLALVADSRPLTPPNVLRQYGLDELFEHLSISEVVGASKPAPDIFLDALNALHIAPADYGTVVMVGNNLECDVAGANRLGLISVFFHWTERRRTQPLDADEQPRYVVHSAPEIVALIDRLDAA